MNNSLKDEKGFALVVTLGIVAILLATALQLGKFTGDSVISSLADNDRFQAYQAAVSGINLARLILVEDAKKNTISSVQETWADQDKLKEAVETLGLEKDTLKLEISDELSKIQVNALISEFPGNLFNSSQLKIWENFLRLRFSDNEEKGEDDAAEIINSVKDWLDSGDDDAITGLSGAESEYYLALDPPYPCANGPVNQIDELLNIKGVSGDMFKEEIEQDPEGNPDQVEQGMELSDVFTVYGLDSEKSENGGYRYSGRVNINTAGVDVLAALLPEGMDDFAQELVDFREQKSEEGTVFLNPLDKGWYKKVINLSEEETDRLDSFIRYGSDIFKIQCSSQKNDAKVSLVAFVKRERIKGSGKWNCRVIQMERE